MTAPATVACPWCWEPCEVLRVLPSGKVAAGCESCSLLFTATDRTERIEEDSK